VWIDGYRFERHFFEQYATYNMTFTEEEARAAFEKMEMRTAPGLLEQWHSQPMPIRVIHVGAGATGLCCAHKMECQLSNYELVCYEKNSSIGGTWFESMRFAVGIQCVLSC
jgi:ribulose 1,5-bisphosphate synthetase/thiazole synthase